MIGKQAYEKIEKMADRRKKNKVTPFFPPPTTLVKSKDSLVKIGRRYLHVELFKFQDEHWAVHDLHRVAYI